MKNNICDVGFVKQANIKASLDFKVDISNTNNEEEAVNSAVNSVRSILSNKLLNIELSPDDFKYELVDNHKAFYPTEIILKFIDGFKLYNPDGVKTTFLQGGYCYWFAHILAERFRGDIVIDLYDNHFMTKINNRFFDIRGEVLDYSDDAIVLFSDYEKIDKAHYDRLVRDCIYKY